MSALARRAVGYGLVVALVAYAVPKYAWPLVLERARSEIRRETVAPPPAPAAATVEPTKEDGWTGVLLTPTVEMTARVDAQLLTMRARVGDKVHAGDLLAELDTTIQKHEIAAAEASLRASRAETWQASVTLAQARDRQARRNGVVKYGSAEMAVASNEEIATARFDSAAARGRVGSAAATAQERQARVAQLRAILEGAKVTAPFEGTIAARYVEPGSHVQTGMPLLRIVGHDTIRARFAVPETEGGRVQLGTKVTLEWEGNHRGAVVDRIAPEVESASGTIFVEAAVNEAGEKVDPSALTGRVITVSLAPASGS